MSRANPLMIDRLLSRVPALAAAAACAAYVGIYAGGIAWPPIRADAYSYYAYLPAWVIFHDPTFEALARDCCGGTFPEFSAMFRWRNTGPWGNPHPMGTAILALPFFLIAHALTRWSNLSPDGFSLYYQVVTGLAGPFYLGLGLWFLAGALRRHFDAPVTLATLAAIVFGTNLFHYATYDSLYSHVFAFCLFAALLWQVPRWLEAPTCGRSVALGVIAGLLVLTRLTHGLLLLFAVLYGITGRAALRARLAWLRTRWAEAVTAAATCALVILPQLAMHWQASRQWLASPYGPHGGFNFASPRIFGVLFSTQKGLFFWSPLLLLAVTGFVSLRRYAPAIVLPVAIVLPLEVYLVASWFDWQFGASFGHRAFTDLLPVLAFGLAALFARVRQTRWRPLVVGLTVLVVALSVAQMLQYWFRIIPFDGTTWEVYRANFLRFSR